MRRTLGLAAWGLRGGQRHAFGDAYDDNIGQLASYAHTFDAGQPQHCISYLITGNNCPLKNPGPKWQPLPGNWIPPRLRLRQNMRNKHVCSFRNEPRRLTLHAAYSGSWIGTTRPTIFSFSMSQRSV